MITVGEVLFLSICVEGFLYGLYSGIFVIYIQCSLTRRKESAGRTPIILFYALGLLYVLSTVLFVCDWVYLIFTIGVILRSFRTLPLQPEMESMPMLLRLDIFRDVVNGFCDVIAQCILIYRCWIVWGKNIHVVIIPALLTIVYLATWLASTGALTTVPDLNWLFVYISDWSVPVILTSYAASMAVNALVTGLIVFKILKLFLEVKATSTSVERTLGSTAVGTKLQHIMFVIIESGMALFAVQLVRALFVFLPISPPNAYDFVAVINQMLNGITPTIILVRVLMRLSFDDKESFNEAIGSLRFDNPPSDDPDTHCRMETFGSSGSMLPQETSEDDIVEVARS